MAEQQTNRDPNAGSAARRKSMVSKKMKYLKELRRLVANIIALIIFVTSVALGQSDTASITGTVKDATGAAVPGATVTVKQTETGMSRTVKGDVSGSFSIPSLPIGNYQLTAEMTGFQREVLRGITLVVGQEAVTNVTLHVGSIDQEVTVTDAPPLVNATVNSTSGVISEAQIKDLPLNGRSFDQLLTLNAGAVNNSSNVGGGYTAFSVSGQRPESNRYLLNGVDYIGTNPAGTFITPLGVSGELLGVEAVREFEVLLHTYGAEYGKRIGAQISIVTTSGTNQLHGDVFEYIRNNYFDARNYFDATSGAPPFKRNQFGGAIGGPLKRNKAFLFGTYEGFRQSLATSSVSIVPDAQARQGFLPCYIVIPSASCLNPNAYVRVTNLQPGILPYAQLLWPTVNGPELLSNGQPTGVAQAISNPPSKIQEDYGLVRFDITLSTKDSFSANYTADYGNSVVPQANPIFNFNDFTNNGLASLQETHVFSSNLLNVLTVGYSRTQSSQSGTPTVQVPANLDFLTGLGVGAISIGGGAVGGGASSIAPTSGQRLFLSTRNYFTEADDVHFNKGKQTITAGVWIQQLQMNLHGSSQANSGSASYPSLLTFLQDLPTQFSVNSNPTPVDYRTTEAAWYVQDEVKMNTNFTFRVGLRDEMTNGWNEAHGRASNYVYDANGIPLTNPVVGHSALQTNYAKALIQPRVGLAWDPAGDQKWAVQAAFGVYNDLQDNLGRQFNNNAPFNAISVRSNTPLLSIIPVTPGQQAPPSCNAQSPLVPPACSIFGPYGVDPNFHTPTLLQWSLTVQRELMHDLMLEVSYVGSESYHTATLSDRNVAPPQICSNTGGCLSGGTLAAKQAVIVPAGTLYEPSTPGLRPNPDVGATQTWFFNGTSSYQAGNVSLNKRASHGLTFKGNYTFAKLLDVNSGGSGTAIMNEPPTVLNPYDIRMGRGLAAFSIKHQFNANFIYQLPFGKGQRFATSGFADKVLGGWLWNGSFNAESGFPFTPTVGTNISGTGDSQNPDVPNLNPNFRGPVVTGNVHQWFNPNAFLLPTAGTFGNAGRGVYRGPVLADLDTSLIRNMHLTERLSMQFRAEVFNILNRANFGLPNTITFSGSNYSPSAGVITVTSTTSRQLQFALKVIF